MPGAAGTNASAATGTGAPSVRQPGTVVVPYSPALTQSWTCHSPGRPTAARARRAPTARGASLTRLMSHVSSGRARTAAPGRAGAPPAGASSHHRTAVSPMITRNDTGLIAPSTAHQAASAPPPSRPRASGQAQGPRASPAQDSRARLTRAS